MIVYNVFLTSWIFTYESKVFYREHDPMLILKNQSSCWKVKVKFTQSCPTLCNPTDCQNTGVGCLSLLQGIFPIQGLNPGLLYCRQSLYQLSHQGSPRMLEWAAYPFSRGSSRPRNWTRVFSIEGRFFTNWTIRKAPLSYQGSESLSFGPVTCVKCF